MLTCRPAIPNLPQTIDNWFSVFQEGRPSGHVDGLEFLAASIFCSSIITLQQKCALLYELFDLDGTDCIRAEEFTILLKVLCGGLFRISTNFPSPPSYLELKSVAADILEALNVSELRLYDFHVWLTETVPAIHIAAAFAPGIRTSTLAFGINDRAQLGLSFAPLAQVLPSPLLTLEKVNVVQVASGRAHTLFLDAAGSVYACGSGLCGALGLGSTNDAPAPVKVPGLPEIVHVAVGARHSAAVSRDGRLFVWGSADLGQLGIGAPPSNPGAASTPEEAARVWDVDPRTGDPFSFVVHPLVVSALEKKGVSVRKVACSAFTTAVVDANGRVWCAGESSLGQTGLGAEGKGFATTRGDSVLPTSSMKIADEFFLVPTFGPPAPSEQVNANDDRIGTHAGTTANLMFGDATHLNMQVNQNHATVAVSETYGSDSNPTPANETLHAVSPSPQQPMLSPPADGALPAPQPASYLSPEDFYPRTQVVDLVAGDHHYVALDDRGDVWTWGAGEQGALGLGGVENAHVPKRVRQLHNRSCSAVSAGSQTSAAVASTITFTLPNITGVHTPLTTGDEVEEQNFKSGDSSSANRPTSPASPSKSTFNASNSAIQIRALPLARADLWAEPSPSPTPQPIVPPTPVVELPCPWIEPDGEDLVLGPIPNHVSSVTALAAINAPGNTGNRTTGGAGNSNTSPNLGAGMGQQGGPGGGNAYTLPSDSLAKDAASIYNGVGLPQLNELTAQIKATRPVVMIDQPLTEGVWFKVPQCRFDFRLTPAPKAAGVSEKLAIRGPVFMPVRDPKGAFEVSDVSARVCVFDAYTFLSQPIPNINFTGLPKPPAPPKAWVPNDGAVQIVSSAGGPAGATGGAAKRDQEGGGPNLTGFDWDLATTEELFAHLSYRSVLLLAQGALGVVYILPPGMEQNTALNTTKNIKRLAKKRTPKKHPHGAECNGCCAHGGAASGGTLLPGGSPVNKQVSNNTSTDPKPCWRSEILSERLKAIANNPSANPETSPFYANVRAGSQLDEEAVPLIVSEQYASRLADFPIFTMAYSPAQRLRKTFEDHVKARLASAAANDPDGVPEELRNWREKRGEFATRSYFEHVVTGVCRWAVPPVSLPGPVVIVNIPPPGVIPPLVSRLRRVLSLNPAGIIVAQRSVCPSLLSLQVDVEPKHVVDKIKDAVLNYHAALETHRAELSAIAAANSKSRKPGMTTTTNPAATGAIPTSPSTTQTTKPGGVPPVLASREEAFLALNKLLDAPYRPGTLTEEEIGNVPIALVSFDAAETIRTNLHSVLASKKIADAHSIGVAFSVVGSSGLQFRGVPDPDMARKEDTSRTGGAGMMGNARGGRGGGGGAGGPSKTSTVQQMRGGAGAGAGGGAGESREDPLVAGLGGLAKGVDQALQVRADVDTSGGALFTWGACEHGGLMLSQADVHVAKGSLAGHDAKTDVVVAVKPAGRFAVRSTPAVVRPVLASGLIDTAPMLVSLHAPHAPLPLPPSDAPDWAIRHPAPVVDVAMGKTHMVVTHANGSLAVSGRADCLGTPTAEYRPPVVIDRIDQEDIIDDPTLEEGVTALIRLLPVAAPVTARTSVQCVMESIPAPVKLTHVEHVGEPVKVFAGHNATFVVTKVLPDPVF